MSCSGLMNASVIEEGWAYAGVPHGKAFAASRAARTLAWIRPWVALRGSTPV